MHRDTLRGGAVRFCGESATFVFQRLKPSVLFTSCRGTDTGEFGISPLEAVEREHRLFGRPVQWLFDAELVENAAQAVSERWTSWLRRRSEMLAGLHVLTVSAATHITISLVRHLADSHKSIHIYRSHEEWIQAVRNMAPELEDLTAFRDRFEEPAIAVNREDQHRWIRLTAPSAEWRFRQLRPDVVFSSFAGNDSGVLTDPALDEMDRLLDAAGRSKLRWFIDVRNARTVLPEVSRAWTDWLTVRRDRFARITAVAESPLFPLVLTVASYQSSTEGLVHIHREIAPFRDNLANLCDADEIVPLHL